MCIIEVIYSLLAYYIPRVSKNIASFFFYHLHGSHACWKILEFSFIFQGPWKVLEIYVGSGKFWKFDVKVLEGS